MAMMMTGEVSGADAFGVEILTNDDQRIPLPTTSVLCALDGGAQLGVGLLDVAVRLLGALVDLRNGRLLLVYQLGDFVVQLAECDEVLFDLANGGGTLESGLAGIVGLASTGTGNLFAIRSDHRNPSSSTYHKALLLTHQDVLHTLLQLLGGSLGVGDFVSAAHLLLQTLLEVGLCALVLLDLTAEVAADVLDLARHTAVARSRGLLDALELIAQVAQRSVDLILNVVKCLTRSLVLLSGARVQQGLLRVGQLGLALRGQLGDTFVEFLALVQNRSRPATGGLVDVGHFCWRQRGSRRGRIETYRSHRFQSPRHRPGRSHPHIHSSAAGCHRDSVAGCRMGCTGRSPLGCYPPSSGTGENRVSPIHPHIQGFTGSLTLMIAECVV